ncbi:hypothetical protein KS4_14990 [Poriferisphaera corsica]|uniref:Uncharacterized protein n=1 Tax=Poriferisphaera corsica TaxID=2528020 RepID=A0A517YTB9_9BACT|nr:hypothetical protein KS4_14990 [Poriferisphaera corsica]
MNRYLQVRDSFDSVFPGIKLAAEVISQPYSRSEREFEQHLMHHSRDDIARDFWRQNGDNVTLLLPEAFRYFLPSIIKYSINELLLVYGEDSLCEGVTECVVMNNILLASGANLTGNDWYLLRIKQMPNSERLCVIDYINLLSTHSDILLEFYIDRTHIQKCIDVWR